MSTLGGLGPVGRFMDHLLWGSVEAMTTEQVHQLRDRFVQAALICSEAGFDGVELHGSHGYQLAAFLSPRPTFAQTSTAGPPRIVPASCSRSSTWCASRSAMIS